MAADWKADEHEEPDVGTWRVLALVFGFVAFVALLFGGLNVYYHMILTDRAVDIGLRDFPAPRLQPNPTQDYDNFHAAQQIALQRGAGMPIEKAMATVVARGAQGYDPIAGTPPSTGSRPEGAPRAVPSAAVAPFGQPQ